MITCFVIRQFYKCCIICGDVIMEILEFDHPFFDISKAAPGHAPLRKSGFPAAMMITILKTGMFWGLVFVVNTIDSGLCSVDIF